MGRQKKGFNWKSRQNVEGEIDNSETKKLMSKLEFAKSSNLDENDSNALVLPSSKRAFKKTPSSTCQKRILSKRKRKQLERIVDQKRKKLEREDLIEKLKDVQIPSVNLEKMTSLSYIQTKGLKHRDQFFNEDRKGNGIVDGHDVSKPTRNLKFKGKTLEKDVEKETNDDPNVVGFQSSSDESSSDESEANMETNESLPVKTEAVKEEVKESNQPPITNQIAKENNLPQRPLTLPKTVFVPVNRRADIQSAREKLPVLAEEQSIMEAVRAHPVVIMAGETGSGKSTQIPQFLYEAGFCSNGKIIGITEPRRVAAISVSRRVAEEMSFEFGDRVGYQIRFEGNVSDENTQIKFMTDGVLLREIEKDFLLTKYSAIILDEAHERSVFTDILIGLLSRIVPKRNKNGDPLKLIVMSATLRVEDFTENSRLFKTPPPVIKVESRQFDVTAHFNRRTHEDYVKEAIKKVSKIHQTLPDGGILVFLTGQKEVNYVVRKLRNTFPSSEKDDEDNDVDHDDDDDEDENVEKELLKALKKRPRKQRINKKEEEKEKGLPSIDLNDYRIVPLADHDADANDEDCFDDDLDDDMHDILPENKLSSPLWVLPLYSLLSSERQARVFQEVPKGHRLCVVATNVAETSLTIPGIKYVVDSGKVKNKFYDKVTGVSKFNVTWISRAQANQRAGRAGRIGAGHCYRLYSSAVFQHEFEEHSEPEILKRPVEDLVLQMKAMKMDNIMNFPFPTPPDPLQIRIAERKLVALGALEHPGQVSYAQMFKSKITKLGKAISTFPLSPKFGKMLALSHQHELLPYTITLVAALSVPEALLSNGSGDTDIQKIRRSWAGKGNSLLLGDPMVLIRAVGAAEYAGCTPEFCGRYGLRHKGMMEIRKLRRQLTNEINLILPGQNLSIDPNLSPPTDEQAKLLRQIILSGLPDQVARKIDNNNDRKWKYAYKWGGLKDPLFLQRSCALRDTIPQLVCFQEVFETDGKMLMRGVTAIESEWLPIYANRS